MARMTERVLDLLRLMHGGARLRVLPKGTALLDTAHVAPGVRRATVEAMVADGFITRGADAERWEITEKGRDAVRVRDGVDEFVHTDTATSTDYSA